MPFFLSTAASLPHVGRVVLVAGHDAHEFVVHDLDHELTGLEALDDLLALGLGDDLGAELLDDVVVDIGFKQRGAHLVHRLGDVGFGNLPFAGKVAKNVGETFGERFKHV